MASEMPERTPEDRARAAAERAARRSGSYDEPMTAVDDRPVPPRRVPPTRRPPRRPPPRRSRPSGGYWGRRLLAVMALLVIPAALYLINATFQPFHGEGSGSVRIAVPEGADAGAIGDVLAAKGVVASGTFFELNATLTGRRGGLRPGSYTLRRDMSYGDAIDALTKGPKVRVVPTVDVTVPEGPSIRETAPIVDKGPLEGSYAKAAAAPRVLRRVRRLGAPRGTRTAEGFLFPATYTLVDGSPARDLVSKQLAAFRDNFAKVDMSYARSKNLTRYEVLIIASLVEREAQLARERPMIASSTTGSATASRWGSTPRSATRSRTGRAPCGSPSSRPTRPTTPVCGATCRRRRSATPASPPSRRPPSRPAATTCSSCASPETRASTRSRRPTPSSSATWRATRPRAAVLDLPGRLRLAGRALALAPDAQRRARRPRARGLALPPAAAAA
jgi:hypothetical protein